MGERDGTPRGLDGDRSGDGGAGFVVFDSDPKAGTPIEPEEIYEAPSSARFSATPSPTPVSRSARPLPQREVRSDVPSMSALRRHPENEPEVKPRSWRAVLVVVGLLAFGCAGASALGAGALWMQVRAPQEVVPVEPVPVEPPEPEEVGGIPLEKGLRRGPAVAPKRPEVPDAP